MLPGVRLSYYANHGCIWYITICRSMVEFEVLAFFGLFVVVVDSVSFSYNIHPLYDAECATDYSAHLVGRLRSLVHLSIK